MKVLGISCYYHDSAAALVKDGEIISAAAEERFTRQKHDKSYPEEAINYCLGKGNIEASDLDKVVFYEKPVIKFERILTTAANVFPKGYRLFSQALPEWLGTKLRIKKKIRNHLGSEISIEFLEHHHSHAASAYLPSPFEKAAVLTVDGVGEWKTNQMWRGKDGDLEPIKHMDFPDSIGLLYSTITAYLGFMVNNGEFKVMGLASYGEPKFQDEFKEIISIGKNGSYELNQEYFAYRSSKKMWSAELEELLGNPRKEGQELTQRHKDIAATMQKILEKVILRQTEHLYDITDTENLCMAGGVALNSACNGELRKKSSFKNIWIQPAAGDAGGALGAALSPFNSVEPMKDVYYGPEYSDQEVKEVLENQDISYTETKEENLPEKIAESLQAEKIVALFQGRMEWGPRALGNRSIIADPRSPETRDMINRKVKFRESFRPFAPSVNQEYAHEYFDIEENKESPYMLFVYNVKEEKKKEIPAVTHINGTSRIQTVNESTNRTYYNIIEKFRQKTGVPVILNTSFNLKGMPIVRTPEEAINCFKKSDIDELFLNRFIIKG